MAAVERCTPNRSTN